jgi:hypothetical protein
MNTRTMRGMRGRVARAAGTPAEAATSVAGNVAPLELA